MKVLISRISYDVTGGAELSAFDQAVALKELGHEPIFATNLQKLRIRAEKEGIKTLWFPWVNRGPGKLRQICFLGLLPFTYIWAGVVYFRTKPDLINPHSREDQNAFTLTKWLHRRPVVWKDASDLRNQLSKGNYLYRKLQIRAVKKANHIYLLNEEDRQNLASIAGEQILAKTSAVPASILYRYYDRLAKPKAKHGKIVIGTLARAEEDKGLQHLIEAVRKLGCDDKVEFWLINDGAYKPELEIQAADLPCVRFFSYTEDVSSFLNSFDILVHPAEDESWGRIIKEAMYFGLPIIGSKVGGIKQQLEHGKTGLLFEPRDTETLAALLRKLLESESLRKTLGQSAQAKAEDDGDFIKVVDQQILPLYQHVLKSKHIVIDGRIRRSSTGRYTDRLVEHLQTIDTDNTYTVLIEPDDPWPLDADNFRTTPCRFKQFSFNPLDQISFSWQLYRLKADLTHFTMTQQPIFYFGKIVTTTHDLTMFKYARAGKLPEWLHKIRMVLYRFLTWWSHRKSNKIIVPSRFVANGLADLQPFTKNKTTVTYEAGESAIVQKSRVPKFKSSFLRENKFLLYVGTAFPHKNLSKLVDAFGILHKQNPDLRLILAGKKEYYYEKLIEHVAMKPYWEAIHLPGFVSDEELKWLYENAQVYVFPSLSEGFGLPALEAMAHGCPVVSSNATCLPEIYGEAASYFNPEDIKDMAATIRQVLENENLRQELIKKGFAQSKKYSWSKMAEETLAIYGQVFKEKGGRSESYESEIFFDD